MHLLPDSPLPTLWNEPVSVSFIKYCEIKPKKKVEEPVIARSRRRRSNLVRAEKAGQRVLHCARNDTSNLMPPGGGLSCNPKCFDGVAVRILRMQAPLQSEYHGSV